MRCRHCIEGLEHCHEVSIEHTDGFTECGGDGPCALPHQLHDWRISCAELDPPCPCAEPVDVVPADVVPADVVPAVALPERLAA